MKQSYEEKLHPNDANSPCNSQARQWPVCVLGWNIGRERIEVQILVS